jgi:pimeloyl-ACP methyl ester carboxylesterase
MSYYKHNDLDIYYKIDGNINDEKPVIVLLNGIMMSSLSWEMFTESFTQNNTLIRYDMVDQGKSSTVDYQYTQELQVEVLKGLLDHLQLQKVHIVGISYGASISLQFAAKFPNYIDKMVVANVVAKTSPWLKSIGDGWNKVGKSRDGEAYYHISIPYIYSPQFYQKRLTWMENRKKILVPIFSDPDFLDAMERKTISAETHDVREALPNITIDTLIISTKEDYLTPMYEQNYIHSNMPKSQLVLLQECGHASMYEKPTQFTELVLGHINNKIDITL